MSEKVKITLTDARPMLVSKATWPLVSKASEDTDHNNQDLNRRYYLRVRLHCRVARDGEDTVEWYGGDKDGAPSLTQHVDGRVLVYGWSESSWQGESDNQAGYCTTLEDAPARIREVAEAIGADESLVMECISHLPAVDEADDTDGLPCTLSLDISVDTTEQAAEYVTALIAIEQHLREANGISGHVPVSPLTKIADSTRDARQELQRRAGLVAAQ